jgi:hypothetical protein
LPRENAFRLDDVERFAPPRGIDERTAMPPMFTFSVTRIARCARNRRHDRRDRAS